MKAKTWSVVLGALALSVLTGGCCGPGGCGWGGWGNSAAYAPPPAPAAYPAAYPAGAAVTTTYPGTPGTPGAQGPAATTAQAPGSAY